MPVLDATQEREERQMKETTEAHDGASFVLCWAEVFLQTDVSTIFRFPGVRDGTSVAFVGDVGVNEKNRNG